MLNKLWHLADYTNSINESTLMGFSQIQAARFKQSDSLFHILYRWIGACVEIIGNLALFGIAVFGILQRDTLDSSDLGMAISFSMQVSVLSKSLLIGEGGG